MHVDDRVLQSAVSLEAKCDRYYSHYSFPPPVPPLPFLIPPHLEHYSSTAFDREFKSTAEVNHTG